MRAYLLKEDTRASFNDFRKSNHLANTDQEEDFSESSSESEDEEESNDRRHVSIRRICFFVYVICVEVLDGNSFVVKSYFNIKEIPTALSRPKIKECKNLQRFRFTPTYVLILHFNNM